jgi:hypothetical protein
MPKGVTTAMTDGPVSPPTPILEIEVSEDGDDNDRVLVNFDDDDSDSDEPASKTSTPSDGRAIVSFDGNPILAIQVASIIATDDSQNFCVEGDLYVQVPCHLYDVQQDAKPAAANSGSSHVSGTMVPGPSVDHSTSKYSHSSVDGSTSKSSHSSVDGSTSKSSHSSVEIQVAEGGCAFPAQVPTAARDVNDKVSCFYFLSLSVSLSVSLS